MQNYPLLTECAKTMKPIMIKRHYGASLRDWLGAAEYVLFEGNKNNVMRKRCFSYTPSFNFKIFIRFTSSPSN